LNYFTIHSVCLFLLLSLAGTSSAQYEDKSFYLLDSLDLSGVEASDVALLDSMLPLYHSAKDDTARFNVLGYIVEECWADEVWPRYNRMMLDDLSVIVSAGGFANQQEEYKVKAQYSQALNNEGFKLGNDGAIEQAIRYFLLSLSVDEEIGDSSGMASAINNIGFIYYQQGNYGQAFEFFDRAADLHAAMGSEAGLASALNNIGLVQEKRKDAKAALKSFSEAEKLYRKLQDKRGLATSLNNIGSIYRSQGEVDRAMEYFEEAYIMRELSADDEGMCYSLNSMAKVELEQGFVEDAKEKAERSFALAKQIGFPELISNSALLMSQVLQAEAKLDGLSDSQELVIWKQIFEVEQLYTEMRDSIRNVATEKATIEQSMKYQYDKEALVLKQEAEKDRLIVDNKNANQKVIIWAVGAGLVLALIGGFVIMSRLRVTRKQKQIIELQKAEVDEKQGEIMASINYAKRIQQALFQTEAYVSKHLPEHFILLKPKDVVSGDFYWSIQKNDCLYLAVVDCTGHGVPGAFMSMLGIAFLNEVTSVDKALTPGEILQELRTKVINELGQTGETGENRDGMDASLPRYNLKTKEMIWAGANSPLWRVGKSAHDAFTVYKANRQPIGFHSAMELFVDHEVVVAPGDTFYLFTDGYVDQFGGPDGKKLKSAGLKKILHEIYPMDMEEQRNELNSRFINWQNELEQIDDVCIMGIRF